MEAVRLVVGEVRVLRDFDIIRQNVLSGNAVNDDSGFLVRDVDGGLRDDVADAVADQDLHGNLRIFVLGISQVDKRAGDAVGHLVRVRGIDFFKHGSHPFLARSKRSMRSSCGETSP